ncbi:hypothetical protein ACOMHN_043179 [Nucella lapillus]
MANSSAAAALLTQTAARVSVHSLWRLLDSAPLPLPPHAYNNNNNHSEWSTNSSTTFTTSTLKDKGGGGGVGGGEGDVGESSSCSEWQDSQHTLFQLANLCTAIAFLTPVTFRFHLVFLRAMLLLSFLLLTLWSGLFVCLPDLLAWSLLFLMLNAAHLAGLCYTHFTSSLPAPQAGLYSKVFRPVKVSETEFRELCERGSLHNVSKGALYAIEGATPCAHLSVLVKGRLKVTYQRLFLHHVETNQFVDATEYDFMSSHPDHCEIYQVSIAAAEDAVLLRWDYSTLQDHLSTRPFISTLLHYLTGKDVCSQLYALQEQLMQTPDYMADVTSRHSSMVNVRSCLAAHDSSSSTLCPPADLAGQIMPYF